MNQTILNPEDLIALRDAVAFAAQPWPFQHAPRPVRSGQHFSARAMLSGRGLEFAESRPYQHGDDMRSIDWRVTARLGKAHTKVFHAERERPLWVVVDMGASMRFASRRAFKSCVAGWAGTWVAWSARAAGDRVGGVVVRDVASEVLPPRGGVRGVLNLIDALCRAVPVPLASKAEGVPGLVGGLAELQGRLRAGDRVAIFSDFYGIENTSAPVGLGAVLGHFGAYCDVSLFHVRDPIEGHPPPEGEYPVLGVNGLQKLDLRNLDTRRTWSEIDSRRTEALNAMAARRVWPVEVIWTDGILPFDVPSPPREAGRG